MRRGLPLSGRCRFHIIVCGIVCSAFIVLQLSLNRHASQHSAQLTATYSEILSRLLVSKSSPAPPNVIQVDLPEKEEALAQIEQSLVVNGPSVVRVPERKSVLSEPEKETPAKTPPVVEPESEKKNVPSEAARQVVPPDSDAPQKVVPSGSDAPVAPPEVPAPKEPSSLIGERVLQLPNNSHVDVPVSAAGSINISQVLAEMTVINQEQYIKNEDLFGPLENDSVVIVIQVHNRLYYLRQLVMSLSQAKGIESTLLVFSHDFWDKEINSIIRSIDFAKTLQIFYPFSIQTHPNQFPGESPNDCPRDAKKDQAKRLKCTNADWPDLYGHYREAKYSQTKHHWWWKANTLFGRLKATREHDGLFVFLEEDHYVAEDVLHVLNLMDKKNRDSNPPINCDILSLGTYLKKYNYPQDHNKIEIIEWNSGKHNMGMAFRRVMWKRILECKKQFCCIDDYNWDYSLNHVSNKCLQGKLQAMMVKGPRVFHIGECGVHHKKKTGDCEASTVVKKVAGILDKAQKFLYPKELTIVKSKLKKKQKVPKFNGGWSDKRDHVLCLKMAEINITDTHVQGNLVSSPRPKEQSTKLLDET